VESDFVRHRVINMTDETEAQDLPLVFTQRLARLLRHEVGDLLQSVYSVVAILLERLPEDRPQERRLLGDLKARAEVCRYQIDAVVDLVVPVQQNPVRSDLAALVNAALADVRKRYPALEIRQEGEGSLPILVDPRSMAPGLVMLLLGIAQSAHTSMHISLKRSEEGQSCELWRDGFPMSAEQLAWLEQPFATTHQALFGLAAALIRRVSEPHGARITVENVPDGGVCVRLLFPARADTGVAE